jgi:signal recognition particle GTPase
MRALSKLINLNKPDLVLFVGEALVGNDAVDQLNKFNQVLILQCFLFAGMFAMVDGICIFCY